MKRLEVLRHIREKAGHLACNSILYNWTLGSDGPASFAVNVRDPWPGDAGNVGLLESDRGDFWDPEGRPDGWLVRRHGFEWLRDLKTQGGDQGRRQARDMISGWIQRYHHWDAVVWRADITGLRLANWMALYDFFGPSAGEDFQQSYFESVIRQARHLARSLPGNLQGLPMLQGIRGLAFAGLMLEGHEPWLAQALDLLQEETKKQILPDGGHISRSPAQLVEVLRIYIDIRHILKTGEYPVPVQIEHNIDRMAQALRFFRHADRRLALFNGTQEGNETYIDAVLTQSNARGKIMRSLPQSGYERLTLGRSILIADTGTPPSWPYEADAHAAPLAFEFAYGRERVFVSCGTNTVDDDWRMMLRGTGAHNTLTLDDRNACEIGENGHLGRRPRTVTATREDKTGALLIDAVHDGYVPVNGITHRRRFYLCDQGHDLRGEESLTCTVGLSKPVDVAVRFHLHPKAQVSLIQDGTEALIRLGGGSGWRFSHGGGALAIEDSVYCGEGLRPRKTMQLALYGRMESDHAQIKWALRREGQAAP